MHSGNPQDFLRGLPRGAYTTAMVRQHYLVVDWDTHVQRLVKSIAALHAALDGCFSRHYGSLEASRGAGGSARPACTTLRLPTLTAARDLQAGEEAEVAAVRRAVLPPVLSCLRAAAAAVQAADALMLIVAVCPGALSPLDVHAAAWPYAPPPAAAGPAWAAVLGGPRSVPVAKDTAWVSQRRHLEEMRPPGAAEVLLCSREGALLEGLVTSLFVVAEAEAEAEAEAGGGAVLLTAGMDEGVVWGTMREHVLRACRHLGLPVREGGAGAEGRGRWREAFLTNR
jgi:branched-subunit amino acid aminotransferase/4-amino-4-deoxychorismate lyase